MAPFASLNALPTLWRFSDGCRRGCDAFASPLRPLKRVRRFFALLRRVRRFFALHGLCEGVVLAWQPPTSPGADVGEEDGEEEAEPALWRVVLDDGDCEDLEESELDEAMLAAAEERSLPQEVELVLEASWEALEVSVALFAQQEGSELRQAAAHERLGDAALVNEQASGTDTCMLCCQHFLF